MTTVAELPAGFADKVLSAQSTFRSVMDAMARPGSVQRIEAAAGVPAAMMRGTAAIALTLFDHDTPLWLDPSMSGTSEVTKWLKFHTGAPVIADSSICSFALIGEARSLDVGAIANLVVFDRSERSTDAIANTSCTLITIARSDFELLLDFNRDIAYKVLWSVVRLLSARLRVTNDNLRSFLAMSMF